MCKEFLCWRPAVHMHGSSIPCGGCLSALSPLTDPRSACRLACAGDRGGSEDRWVSQVVSHDGTLVRQHSVRVPRVAKEDSCSESSSVADSICRDFHAFDARTEGRRGMQLGAECLAGPKQYSSAILCSDIHEARVLSSTVSSCHCGSGGCGRLRDLHDAGEEHMLPLRRKRTGLFTHSGGYGIRASQRRWPLDVPGDDEARPSIGCDPMGIHGRDNLHRLPKPR